MPLEYVDAEVAPFMSGEEGGARLGGARDLAGAKDVVVSTDTKKNSGKKWLFNNGHPRGLCGIGDRLGHKPRLGTQRNDARQAGLLT
jgi:hypothetical protein